MVSILTGGLISFIIAIGISFGFFFPVFKENEVQISENTTASLLQHVENTLSLVENYMENVKDVQNRLKKDKTPIKEKKILKFFNFFMVLLVLLLGGLIYCKQDENGTLLKRMFNVDVSFKTMNEKIENTLNNVFSFNKEEDIKVSSLDLYHSLGNNNYSTDDKTIRMLSDGEILIASYQEGYSYFVVVKYDNGVNALYTLIDECNIEVGKLNKNDVIGSYNNEYFNCIFKKNNETITYQQAIE